MSNHKVNNENNIPEDFDNLERYAPTLSRLPKLNCFAVPADYFSELPDAIQADVIALSFPRENPFTAPVHYFDELPLDVEASIAMNGIVKENELAVPTNYFEELPLEIELGIKTAAFPKENPFEVPVNYFDYLPSVIQDRIIEINNHEPWYTRILQQLVKPKLALAYASVALLIIFGGYFFNSLNRNHSAVAMLGSKVETNQNTISIEYIDESTLEDALTEKEEPENKTVTVKEQVINYVSDNVDVNTLIGELNDIE